MSVRTQSNQDSQLLLGMQNKSPTWGSCLAVSHKVKYVSFQWNQLHSYLFIQKKWKHIHKLSIAFLHISTNLIPFWNSLFPICSPDFHIYKYYAFSLFIYFWCGPFLKLGFPVGSDGKETACNAGDLGSIPGLKRSSGGEHGSPLQYSCLEKPMDRGAWRATVHGIAKSWTQLSD